MAKLSAFRRDSRAINEGEWIKPGEEFDDLEIRTRGFTDVYADARAAKLRKAALRYGGDTTKIPNAVVRDIIVDCLVTHVLLDVRGLEDDSGQTITFPQFCVLLRDPDYPDLYAASLAAAAQVGQIRADELTDAVGNSPAPSASP